MRHHGKRKDHRSRSLTHTCNRWSSCVLSTEVSASGCGPGEVGALPTGHPIRGDMEVWFFHRALEARKRGFKSLSPHHSGSVAYALRK